MTRIYEELFIVKPDAPDEEVDAFVETIRTQLTTAGATVDKVDKWGKRRLAYRVDKYREGTYVLFQFSGEPTVCLLYTSDAADEEDSVDLGGRRIIKKKK